METNYYNRSNNFSAPIKKEPKPYSPQMPDPPLKEHKESHTENKHLPVLSGFQNDDLLILAIIFLLFSESDENGLLILILGWLFLSAKK